MSQLSLFGGPAVTCPQCGAELPDPLFPGTFSDCPRCDDQAVARFMRAYASHGTRSTRKHPGMSFRSGATIPTPEDSAAAHGVLDELGWPA